MRILIFSVLLLSLSSCLATPRFFPHTYEDDENIKEQKVKQPPIKKNKDAGVEDF